MLPPVAWGAWERRGRGAPGARHRVRRVHAAVQRRDGLLAVGGRRGRARRGGARSQRGRGSLGRGRRGQRRLQPRRRVAVSREHGGHNVVKVVAKQVAVPAQRARRHASQGGSHRRLFRKSAMRRAATRQPHGPRCCTRLRSGAHDWAGPRAAAALASKRCAHQLRGSGFTFRYSPYLYTGRYINVVPCHHHQPSIQHRVTTAAEQRHASSKRFCHAAMRAARAPAAQPVLRTHAAPRRAAPRRAAPQPGGELSPGVRFALRLIIHNAAPACAHAAFALLTPQPGGPAHGGGAGGRRLRGPP